MKIKDHSFEEMKLYYTETIDVDRSSYKSSNDETTPIDCVSEMISKVPQELWDRNDLKILDPCCGNGNFLVPIFYKIKNPEETLYFNDINQERLKIVRRVFGDKAVITDKDYVNGFTNEFKFDLIVANPPFAKLQENGIRASKNHNLIKDFLRKSLSLLKEDGYLLFITPDNWMSFNRDTLITEITSLQIIHLDIHSAKKYFKKIGSSFTWYVIQNKKFYKDINISGVWKKENYTSTVKSEIRRYLPLYYTSTIQKILHKTLNNENLSKFKVLTTSYLHRFTKKQYLSDNKDNVYKFKLIHTPTKVVWSSKPHKFQEGYKVFISTTNKYSTFVDNCGMTQSIAFIMCDSLEEAENTKTILDHPLYKFLNDIHRYGNFNNIKILQHFPIPRDSKDIYESFGITQEEMSLIK